MSTSVQRFRNSRRFVRLPRKNSISSISAMLSRFPAQRLSIPRISYPRAAHSCARALPTKPAIPVINTLGTAIILLKKTAILYKSCNFPYLALCHILKFQFFVCVDSIHGKSRRSANAVIVKASGLHLFRTIKVAAIDNYRQAHPLAEFLKIEIGELTPLRENQQSIGVMGGAINVLCHFHPLAGLSHLELTERARHGYGIVGRNHAAFLKKRVDYLHSR